MSGMDAELRTAIRDEVASGLDQLLELLDAFETSGARPDELLRGAFRLFHNVKGAARIAGLGQVELAARPADELVDDGETRVGELAQAVRFLEGEWR